jgi:uncharacterized lipoprotein YbaY/heat shock protein HslJ
MRLAIGNFALALAACSTLSCGASRPSGEAVPEMSPELPTVQGTATYRERIAMPPNAVFEAILEDVSRADAPAREVGRTTVRQPPQVPIPFTITVDPGKIDPNASYSVRGRIIVDGAQWFVTDMAYPVLTRGAGHNVQLLLKRVASNGGAALMGGEMTYMADAARFSDCASGANYPVAMEADFVKMQRTYLDRVSSPGAKLYVTFEGSLADRPRMEGSGTERTVVVSSFIDAWPNQNCERSRANASLVNMYWRITQLAGRPVLPPTGSQREPQLILRDMDGKHTYSATVGCNSMSGSYSVAGDRITFASGISTLMACPPPRDTLELQLRTAIDGTRRWRILGSTLELRDDSGARLALFEATPLK